MKEWEGFLMSIISLYLVGSLTLLMVPKIDFWSINFYLTHIISYIIS